MQDHDWDDLKFMLALQRFGTLSEAGRKTGVAETTVARRLKRLERSLGQSLFRRNTRDKFELTDAGLAIFIFVEAVERQNIALRERLGQISNKLSGTVRISAVPFIANRILVPHLESLSGVHPELSIELVPEARNIDLTKREADLAIRLSRPGEGGLATMARKLGELQFVVFCSAKFAPGDEALLPWIEYEDASASLPQAQWSVAHRKHCEGPASPLRVADLETALAAVISGFGQAILPRMVCLEDKRLRAVPSPPASRRMAREVWLLSHADQDARLSVISAKAWLTGLKWS